MLTAVFCGWRPSNRVTAYVLSAPFLSVSASAWVWGNPFNGTVFAALLFFLLTLASRLSKDPVRFGAPILATLAQCSSRLAGDIRISSKRAVG